ncbi:MAG: hypothetical protein ACFB20_12710 [Opitutales bacterium]
MRIQLGKLVLAAGSAAQEPPTDLTLRAQREVQTAERFRAETAKHIDRGNLRHRVRFSVTRRHVSAEEATRHALEQAALLRSADGTVRFIAEANGREAGFALLDAVVSEAEVRPEGLITRHRYTLLGGAFTRLGPAQALTSDS